MTLVALPNPAARLRLALAALVAVLLLSPLPGSASGERTWDAATRQIASVEQGLVEGAQTIVSTIVRARPGRLTDAEAVVRGMGGNVEASLPIIEGFEATVPSARVSDLAASEAVESISANHAVQFEEGAYETEGAGSNFVATSGAKVAWDSGYTGRGIGVAVIDTGVSPMRDLEGRIVHGPDLSGEGSLVDTYGHGTAMAGIIAGRGTDSNGLYMGVAPDSHVIAVKASGRNGSADVSTVLQAMHFVSAYKDQLNIKVLNLSWGTRSTQDPTVDPLNYAVQRLWRQGIVVVVAGGNSGNAAGTITKPGDDPVALTVGAYNDQQNTNPADDNVPAWSSRGPTATGLTKPDVVAPGRRIVSPRSFGSFVETDNPKSQIAPSYIRGSGSSQAAAVVSGLTALLLEARPSLTPDQVKGLFRDTASPMATIASTVQGRGRVQLGAALTSPAGPATSQTFAGNGLGSIEASRSAHVQTDCNGDGILETIQGEIDVRCEAWNGTNWTGTNWTGTTWTGTNWTGTTWTGTTWTGTNWTGTNWTGTTWTGTTWTGTNWTGTTWTGNTAWTGTTWTGTNWTGTNWTGTTWTGTNWTGTNWTGTTWTATEYVSLFWGDCPKAGLSIVGELNESALALLGLPCA